MPATLADIQRKYGESVYPLYKDEMYEPYMENENGIGFRGVVMYDELEDKVQCSECGGWYKLLASHVLGAHKITAGEYREKNGLYTTIPLCNHRFSEDRRKNAITNNTVRNLNTTGGMSVGSKRARKVAMKLVGTKSQYKNKRNLCDAQIATRMLIVRDMAKKSNINEVTTADLRRYDNRLFNTSFRRFGNIEKMSEALGIDNITKRFEDSELISILRRFVIENKRIPYCSDMGRKNNMPDLKPFCNHFGSWNRAKMMAGLDQLLEEVKGK